MNINKLSGYLLPHPPLLVDGIGSGGEIPATRKAYQLVAQQIRQENPDTLVIFSPHSVQYGDYIHIAAGTTANGDFRMFGAPKLAMEVAYDTALAQQIAALAQKEQLSAGQAGDPQTGLDHGVMVPLHFLGTETKIVQISLSGLSLLEHYCLGRCVRQAAEKLERKIVLLASGDMSHKLLDQGPYGYAAEGPQFDHFMCECIQKGECQRLLTVDRALYEAAAECGLRSLIMLLGAMDGLAIKSQLLCYEGPYGVGYLTASFEAAGQDASLLPVLIRPVNQQLALVRKLEDRYVSLARNSIEHFVCHGERLTLPEELPEEMLTAQAGVFVSIKKNGQLRGCIGTIAPTQENIAQEILTNSVSAAAEDPRFAAVKIWELAELQYSVDILAPAEQIDRIELLDVTRYGVIVTSRNKRGLLLPNLDGIETVEQQVAIAKQKAGITEDEFYLLERFEVVRHR